MSIPQLAKNVCSVQRNFDLNYVMPREHIDYIVDACTSMPTKQQQELYDLFILTNTDNTKKLFEYGHSEEWDDQANEYVAWKQNGQFYSTCTMIWANTNKDDSSNRYMSIGIAAGAAALAASELGYKTGFGVCMYANSVDRLLEDIFKDEDTPPKFDHDTKPVLCLGIGNPNPKGQEIYNSIEVENVWGYKTGVTPKQAIIEDGRINRFKPSDGKKQIKVFIDS